MSQRNVLILVSSVSMAAILALFAWAMVRTGGNPGGLVVNSQLGEASVKGQGGPARDFDLTLFDGPPLSLSGLQGKVVMVDFWSSWCIPCKEEAPVLAQIYREYQGRDVEFVGISIWDVEGDARRFVQRYGVGYPNGLDPVGRIAIDYGVTGIPEKYFVDRSGRLMRKFIGPMGSVKLREVLDELLGSPAP